MLTEIGEGFASPNEGFIEFSVFFVDFGRALKFDLDLSVNLSIELKLRPLDSKRKEENLNFFLGS